MRAGIFADQLFYDQSGGIWTCKELDTSQLMGDLQVEAWIARQDNFPRRALMDEVFSSEEGVSSASDCRIELSRYGQTPLVPIDHPAFFNEAQ